MGANAFSRLVCRVATVTTGVGGTAFLTPALAYGGPPAMAPERAMGVDGVEDGSAQAVAGVAPEVASEVGPVVVATAGAEPGWLPSLAVLPADPALLTLLLAVGGLVWMRRRTV